MVAILAGIITEEENKCMMFKIKANQQTATFTLRWYDTKQKKHYSHNHFEVVDTMVLLAKVSSINIPQVSVDCQVQQEKLPNWEKVRVITCKHITPCSFYECVLRFIVKNTLLVPYNCVIYQKHNFKVHILSRNNFSAVCDLGQWPSSAAQVKHCLKAAG